MARLREFDEDEVLDKALLLFWERGYEGTSLNDLLQSTGLTKSSLYQAFGSKEGLFERVVQRYHDHHLGFRYEALSEPTPRRIVERLLYGMVELHVGKRTPAGCLETGAALFCSPESDSIRRELARSRGKFRRLLGDRLKIVKDAGPLPPGMIIDDLTLLVATVIQGMAVQAKSGATRAELRRTIRALLLSWPED
jgi:AcrR family transcriptional regulator